MKWLQVVANCCPCLGQQYHPLMVILVQCTLFQMVWISADSRERVQSLVSAASSMCLSPGLTFFLHPISSPVLVYLPAEVWPPSSTPCSRCFSSPCTRFSNRTCSLSYIHLYISTVRGVQGNVLNNFILGIHYKTEKLFFCTFKCGFIYRVLFNLLYSY